MKKDSKRYPEWRSRQEKLVNRCASAFETANCPCVIYEKKGEFNHSFVEWKKNGIFRLTLYTMSPDDVANIDGVYAMEDLLDEFSKSVDNLFEELLKKGEPHE